MEIRLHRPGRYSRASARAHGSRHHPVELPDPDRFPLRRSSAGCGQLLRDEARRRAPLNPIRLGELALEAGLPPGALNIVPGFGEEAGAPAAIPV